MEVPEIAAAFADKIARDDSHGYDQTNRWGPDYDCSSLVITAYKQAGVPLTCTYTGNMKADMLSRGFKDVTKKITLKTGKGLLRGDVLLNETHHTAICVGDGKLLHAAGNEYGKATGGKTGDQTGKEICTTAYFNFPWDCVLRYEDTPKGEGRTYTVKSGDSLWGIAVRELGNGFLYEDIKKLNGLESYMIYPGQVLKLPGGESTAKVTVELKWSVLNRMEKAATDRGITLAELIEEAFK